MNEKLKRCCIGIIVTVLLLVLNYSIFQGEGGTAAIHKKEGIFIIAGDAVVLFLTFMPRGMRARLQNKRIIKALNPIILLSIPAVTFILVQFIIGNGSFRVNNSYLIVNLVLYYTIYILVLLLFGRVGFSILVYGLLLAALGLTSYFVNQFRGHPFMLMDVISVGTAAAVVGGYEFVIPVELGGVIILFFALLVFEYQSQIIEIGRRSVKGYLLRMGAIVIILAVLFLKKSFLPLSDVYFWDVNSDYVDKGFIYMLLSETRYLEVEKPENYSAAKAEEIAEEKVPWIEDEEKIVPENLIVIMNESLADFEAFENLKCDSQILPVIRGLEENVKRGYVHVPVYGGGTSDTEWELLTGNTKQFLPGGSIAYELYIGDPEYGMAEMLKEMGYSTIAVHPGWAASWSRDQVYSDMRFDEFISIDNWEDEYDIFRLYQSDWSTYQKLIKLYEEKEEQEKLFLFCVTIQNHGGYSSEDSYGFESTVSLTYDTEYPMAENYLSLAQESDKAFEKLIDYFADVEDPTMIVMFGDHWPNLEEGFCKELLGKELEELELEELQQCYATPYIMWTNYPFEFSEEDMSSNYLGSYIMEQAGLDLSPYNRFLLRMKETLPIVGMGMVCDANGKWYEMEDMPEEYEEWMNEYQILQYNNVFGKKNRVDNIFRLAQ